MRGACRDDKSRVSRVLICHTHSPHFLHRCSVTMSLGNPTLPEFHTVELNTLALNILRDSTGYAGHKMPEIALSSLSFGELLHLIFDLPYSQDCRHPNDPFPHIRLLPHVSKSLVLHQILRSYLMAAAGVPQSRGVASGYCSSAPYSYTCLLLHLSAPFYGYGRAGVD